MHGSTMDLPTEETGFADDTSSDEPEKRQLGSEGGFADGSNSDLEIIEHNSSYMTAREMSASSSNQLSTRGPGVVSSSTLQKPLLNTIYPSFELGKTTLQAYFSSLGPFSAVHMAGGSIYSTNVLALICGQFRTQCPAKARLERTQGNQWRLIEFCESHDHSGLNEMERTKNKYRPGRERTDVPKTRKRRDHWIERDDSEAEYLPDKIPRFGTSSIRSAPPSTLKARVLSDTSQQSLIKAPFPFLSAGTPQIHHRTPQSTPLTSSFADADSTPPIASTSRATFSPPLLPSISQSPTEKAIEETLARVAKLRQSNAEEAASLARLRAEKNRRREAREKKKKEEREKRERREREEKKKRDLEEALKVLRAAEEKKSRLAEEREKAEAAMEESDMESESSGERNGGYEI